MQQLWATAVVNGNQADPLAAHAVAELGKRWLRTVSLLYVKAQKWQSNELQATLGSVHALCLPIGSPFEIDWSGTQTSAKGCRLIVRVEP